VPVRKDKTRDVWVIDFYYSDKAGVQKRYRRDSTSPTKKAAEQEENRIAANCAIYGGPVAPVETQQDGAITFASAVAEFRAGAAKVELKASTRSGYDEILDGILIPEFGKTPIREIDYAPVQKLDGELKDRGCSTSRRRNVQIVLRSVLHVAVDLKRMREFPKLPPLPKVGKTNVKAPSVEQVERIIACASDAASWAIALAAYCGLRAGEIRALLGRHVDLRGWITVEHSLCHGEVDTPKSGHQRKVPIPQPLLVLFKALKRKGRLGPDAHVALNGDGDPWGETGLCQAFKRAAKKAGIVGFSFHTLRHFYATHLFRSGVAAPTVQAIAGHESLDTTQRYAHTSEDEARDAGDRFGKFVGNLWETTPENDSSDE